MIDDDDRDNVERLTAILAFANDASHGDLRARLQWLEDASLAADSCAVDDDRLKKGALDLKAALGAIAKYATELDRSAHTGSPKPDVDQLEAVVRVLIARGTSSLFASLSDAWSELASEGPMRAQAKLLADAFRSLATSTARGEPPSSSALAKIAEVASSLDDVKSG